MKKVNKDLVLCATMSLKESKHDMTIPWMGGYRTIEDQKKLYSIGTTNCDGIIKKSCHQSGNALDIIPYNPISEEVKIEAQRAFSKLMYQNWQKLLIERKVKGILEWGGIWKNGWDQPHYQITYN